MGATCCRAVAAFHRNSLAAAASIERHHGNIFDSRRRPPGNVVWFLFFSLFCGGWGCVFTNLRLSKVSLSEQFLFETVRGLSPTPTITINFHSMVVPVPRGAAPWYSLRHSSRT